MNALVRRVSTHHLVYNHFRIYCVFILDTSQWEFFRRPRQMKQNNLKRQNKSGDPGESRPKNAPATRCDYIKHQPNKLWPHWKGGDGRERAVVGATMLNTWMNDWMNEFFLFCSQLWLLVKGFHFAARVATATATGPTPSPVVAVAVAVAAAAAGAGAALV